MQKRKQKNSEARLLRPPSPIAGRGRWMWRGLAGTVLVAGATVVAVLASRHDHPLAARDPAPVAAAPANPSAVKPPAPPAAGTNALPVMEVNKAVMVTVELDFGAKVPTIAEALRDVERRYQPDDGQGRTFAILDAYGEPTPQGKLHMSMHVSCEKPGVAGLVFRRTGEVLWQTRIVASTNASPFTGKNLTIFMDDGAGRSVTVDGSNNPATILDATIKEAGVPVSVFWPDETEREFTFIYSACGCPVKAKVKRIGTRTMRTKDLPVMFPDDPAAMTVISRLMGW